MSIRVVPEVTIVCAAPPDVVNVSVVLLAIPPKFIVVISTLVPFPLLVVAGVYEFPVNGAPVIVEKVIPVTFNVTCTITVFPIFV